MRFLSSLALFLGTALPALANDGFGGLSATGLTFDQTDAVEMVEENLYIGVDKITVDYVFRNTTDQDVTGEVIFPLPPVWLFWASEGMNLPEDLNKPDIVDFTATVDGQPVQVSIDQVAVIEEPWVENRPLSEQYDTPGRDVTAKLESFGIPLTLDMEAIQAAFSAMSDEDMAVLDAEGLIDKMGEGPEATYGIWSIVTRYHWTQTFPAGAEVRISHSYTNRPPGGLLYWVNPPDQYQTDYEYQTETMDRYCIDDETSAALAKAMTTYSTDKVPVAYNIAYVLRTANSWAGPIGKFRLTLDKGDPANILSLCAEGLTKTGPTTFVMEKENYTPTKDLEILLVKQGH